MNLIIVKIIASTKNLLPHSLTKDRLFIIIITLQIALSLRDKEKNKMKYIQTLKQYRKKCKECSVEPFQNLMSHSATKTNKYLQMLLFPKHSQQFPNSSLTILVWQKTSKTNQDGKEQTPLKDYYQKSIDNVTNSTKTQDRNGLNSWVSLAQKQATLFKSRLMQVL